MSGIPSNRIFKAIAGLSKVLVVLYFLHMIFCFVGIGITCLGMSVTTADFQADPMAPNARLYIGALIGYGAAQLILFLITAVIHCIWTYRAANNCEAMGARGKQFTPGWSVGWFFIPIANLIQPHRVACEIYNASIPGENGLGWKNKENPSFLGWWWGFYILSGMLTNVSTRLAQSPDEGTMFAGEILGIGAEVVAFFSAWLAIKYVRAVLERQTQSASPATSATSDENPFAAPKPSRSF